MITAKVFEVRDSATFLPVVAVLMTPGPHSTGPEDYLLMRCGYNPSAITVVLFRANGDGSKSWSDAYAWGDRTMQTAHIYIEEHWNELKDGQVIDVEYILNERSKPKLSESHGGQYE